MIEPLIAGVKHRAKVRKTNLHHRRFHSRVRKLKLPSTPRRQYSKIVQPKILYPSEGEALQNFFAAWLQEQSTRSRDKRILPQSNMTDELLYRATQSKWGGADMYLSPFQMVQLPPYGALATGNRFSGRSCTADEGFPALYMGSGKDWLCEVRHWNSEAIDDAPLLHHKGYRNPAFAFTGMQVVTALFSTKNFSLIDLRQKNPQALEFLKAMERDPRVAEVLRSIGQPNLVEALLNPSDQTVPRALSHALFKYVVENDLPYIGFHVNSSRKSMLRSDEFALEPHSTANVVLVPSANYDLGDLLELQTLFLENPTQDDPTGRFKHYAFPIKPGFDYESHYDGIIESSKRH